MSTEIIKIIINDFVVKKASSKKMPTSLFKKCNFVFDTVTAYVNRALPSRILPDSLRTVNVTQIHKKDDPFNKKNYRPAS